jgi:shikimate kinase
MKIFLLGMMGSGKSYWMKKLSEKLDLAGYDLDKLVENVEDRSVKRIFLESGEDHFRKMESIVLKWFADKDDFVLATGGGTACYEDNIDWMVNEGITIWIDEPIDTLVERLIPEKEHRPLIAELSDKNLKEFLEVKLEQRRNCYSKAKFTIHGDELNEERILSLIKNNNA